MEEEGCQSTGGQGRERTTAGVGAEGGLRGKIEDIEGREGSEVVEGGMEAGAGVIAWRGLRGGEDKGGNEGGIEAGRRKEAGAPESTWMLAPTPATSPSLQAHRRGDGRTRGREGLGKVGGTGRRRVDGTMDRQARPPETPPPPKAVACPPPKRQGPVPLSLLPPRPCPRNGRAFSSTCGRLRGYRCPLWSRRLARRRTGRAGSEATGQGRG